MIRELLKFLFQKQHEQDDEIPIFLNHLTQVERRFRLRNGETATVCWKESNKITGYLNGCPLIPMKLEWDRSGKCLQGSEFNISDKQIASSDLLS